MKNPLKYLIRQLGFLAAASVALVAAPPPCAQAMTPVQPGLAASTDGPLIRAMAGGGGGYGGIFSSESGSLLGPGPFGSSCPLVATEVGPQRICREPTHRRRWHRRGW
ncbi:MAG: hypothetical protein ACLP8B_16120 [Xanthobacteraceae bacterium]